MPKKSRKTTHVPAFMWVLLAALVLAATYRIVLEQRDSRHPEPRAGITAQNVVASARFADAPAIARVYDRARTIPHIIDALYCHCDCSKHAGHRSLLECFESDHGAGCDVCLSEVDIAYTMTQQGASLQQIRNAIDEQYGS